MTVEEISRRTRKVDVGGRKALWEEGKLMWGQPPSAVRRPRFIGPLQFVSAE
jgi:hypothetical protein